MDDRGYVAQALFDRLSGEGMRLRILGDSKGYPERAPDDIQLAVPGDALAAIPRVVARFCHDLDLQLVQLAPEDSRAWRCVLAWFDELGRPRFMSVRICSDYCRGPRCYLRCAELLAGSPDTLFAHALVDAVETLDVSSERATLLSELWYEDPRGAMERIARFWRSGPNVRLLAQAAKHGDWSAARTRLAELRRALRRAVLPEPGDLVARVAVAARNLAQPARAAIAFMGRESAARSEVMRQVARDLQPLGLTFFEAGARATRADLRVVFDSVAHDSDWVAVDSSRGVVASAVEVEHAIVRWLECRVERRHPRALVGENPLAARILQFLVRHRVPVLHRLVSMFLNCSIKCRLGSPVLMPYPYGIVIERGVKIGSRVTVMHQVTLAGEVTVEDNVTVGPGAKVIGTVRIGRGATIGPNAVITDDVPSHDTVVVEKRRRDRRSVVNV